MGLALWAGGFSPLAVAVASLAVWVVVVAGLLSGAVPHGPVPNRALAAGLVLVGVAVLTGLSLGWADDRGRAFVDLVRAAGYAGLFVLVVLLPGRGGGRPWLAGIAIGLAATAVVAISPRFVPALDSELGGPIEFLASLERGRLSDPIGYWNGLGGAMATGIVLFAWLGGDSRSRVGRALAAATLPLLVLVLYLTDSRGGALAALVGLVALMLVARGRSRFALPLALGLMGGLGLAALGSTRGDFLTGLGADSATDGLVMGVATILAVVAVGLLAYRLGEPATRLLARLRDRTSKWRWRSTASTRTFLAVAALGFIAVAAFLGPSLLDDFKAPPATTRATEGTEGVASGSGRYQLWGAALDAFASDPISGIGASGFAGWWNRNGAIGSAARDAHSLPIESLAELGIVGFGLLAAFAGIVGVATRDRLRAPRLSERGRSELAAAIGVLLAGATMASIDWTWELPVVFAPTIVAAALIVRPATPSIERRTPTVRWTPGLYGLEPLPERSTARNRAIAAALAVVGAAAIAPSALLLGAELELTASSNALERGDLDAAARHARGAARIEPWAAAPRQQLSAVELTAGNPAAARRWLEDAIARAPFDPVLWRELGEVAAQLGESDRAAAELSRAARLDPRLRR